MDETKVKKSEGVRDRVYKLIQIVLEENTEIPAVYHPIIKNLVKNFLKKTSESDVYSMMRKLNEEVIPWVINGDNHKE